MKTEEIKADICLYGKDIYSFCCYLTGSKVDEIPEIKDPSIGTEGRVLQAEESKFLQNALNSLSDQYRIPVYLYYLNELSQEEIAKCMGLPLGEIY